METKPYLDSLTSMLSTCACDPCNLNGDQALLVHGMHGFVDTCMITLYDQRNLTEWFAKGQRYYLGPFLFCGVRLSLFVNVVTCFAT